LLVGVLNMALVAYLAAVYLLVESKDPVLARLFRVRAQWAWCLVAGFGTLALWMAREEAPEVYKGLMDTRWGAAIVLATLAVNLAAWVALRTRRDRMARMLAAAGAVAMIWGWALSQFPYLVEPSITVYDAAPHATLQMLLLSLLGGSVALLPLLLYLYRLFKGDIIPGVGRS
jgi:cytochrome d ubiquinol oxidase subunit II